MAWVKQDAYYATQGDWNMARITLGGVEHFELWCGKGDAITGTKRRMPRLFDTAADASTYAKWVEDHARDHVEVLAVRKALTPAQMEMI